MNYISRFSLVKRLRKLALAGGLVAACSTLGYGQAVKSVTLSADSVAGGATVTATVTLSANAGTAGQAVKLASSSADATVPATVKVAAGKQTATFKVSTIALSADATAKLTASDSAGSASASLKILAPKLTLLSFNPSTLFGGATSVATVKVGSAAPTNGLKVTLRSSSSALQTPASVTIPQGGTSTTFKLTTLAVTKNTTVTLTASAGGSTIQAPVVIETPTLTKIVLNPTSVEGVATSTATLTISGIAPSSGLKISLVSSSTLATVPKSVTVTSGATTAAFTVNVASSLVKSSATITATDPSLKSVKATLTIAANTTQVVPLPVLDIVYDAVNAKIWAAVDSTGGTYANCIVAVDPQTGAIGKSIHVGVTPGPLAVTDDGQYVYTQIGADGTIRRANLKTGTVDAIYNLGFTSISDIETVPGSPGSFLIATDPQEGVNVSVWDGAKRRTGTGAGGYKVHFAGSSKLMYGDGNNSLFVDTLSPTAIQWTAQYSLNVAGFQYLNGLLYTGAGTVIDPVKQIVLESLPSTDFLVDRGVTVSQADNRIYYVSWSSTVDKRILCFNLKTYQELPFRDVGPLAGGCKHLIACGNHTVAFYNFGDGVTQHLIIIHDLP